MTLHPGTGALAVERLEPRDLADLLLFLEEDPVQHVYWIALALRDALSRPRDEVWAARRNGRILAIVHLAGGSGAVLPLGADRAALDRLAQQAWLRRPLLPHRAQVIGPRRAVSRFVAAFAAGGAEPRLTRDQTYMALVRGALPPFERVRDLRPARPPDFALVFESGARLRAEELQEDPRRVDAAAYARRVDDECRDGFTWIWPDNEGLRFRASVSAQTADAVQIAGVYTPPERRRRGFARRGLSELCLRLFDRSKVACLFVNDFNEPAIALYRSMGFESVADWASAFYDTLG